MLEKPLDCGSMAPSTDQLLHYIYGKGSEAILLVVILVNVVLVSAVLLLACSFCKKYKSKDLHLIKSRKERLKSELTRVTVHLDNGIKNGAIPADAEINSKEKKKNNTSPRLKNGMVHGSTKSKTPASLKNRVLPPPPKTLEVSPPASEVEDPLYDSVNEMKDRVMETRQKNSLSNNKEVNSISETINATISENPESQKIERVNPLYVSADEVKDSTSDLPSYELTKKDEDSKTRTVQESLYAEIRKKPSVKKPPPINLEEKSQVTDSALVLVVLPEEPNNDGQAVDLITSTIESPSKPQTTSDILDSVLNNWKKRNLKSAQPPKQVITVKVGQEVPPPVPVKQFDIESEFEEPKIEADTEIARDRPA